MATASTEDEADEIDEHTKPAFIRRVRIRGYKSIAFCDVPLHPLTILVGRNGAGKSNFLDALAFVRDVMTYGVAEAVRHSHRGGWPALLCRSAEQPTIEIEFEACFTCGSPYFGRTSFDSGTFPVGISPVAAADLIGKRLTVNYKLEFRLDARSTPIISKEFFGFVDDNKSIGWHFRTEEQVLIMSGPVDGLPGSEVLPNSLYLSLLRRPDWPLLSSLGMSPFVDLYQRLRWMGYYHFSPDAMRLPVSSTPGLILESNAENIASVIASMKEEDPATLDRVRDYLKIVVPELAGFDYSPIGDYETVAFHMKGKSRTSTFTSLHMSDGTLRALAALIAAFQTVRSFDFPSVIGIEEPETALHPTAAQLLVDALDEATQRTQIILTTHSADLLSARDVKPGQVLVVQNRDGQTHITPVDSASQEIVRRELYSLAELQRLDQLEVDVDDLRRQADLAKQNGN